MQITLTMKELNRFKVISEANDGHLKVKDAAKILKLSERQIFRLKAKVKKEGAKGVVHKTKGKTKPRWLIERIKDRISYLYKTKYKGFNINHMTEFLNDHEKIKVSRESARQILIAKGSYTPWKKQPRHRQWREPSAKEG